jgi:hypothetical protein
MLYCTKSTSILPLLSPITSPPRHFPPPSTPQRRKRQIHSSSSPKHLFQNVISGIFPSTTLRVYRPEIANFFRTFSHVGSFDPPLRSVLSHVASLPFSLVQINTPSLPCMNNYRYMYGY